MRHLDKYLNISMRVLLSPIPICFWNVNTLFSENIVEESWINPASIFNRQKSDSRDFCLRSVAIHKACQTEIHVSTIYHLTEAAYPLDDKYLQSTQFQTIVLYI